MFKITSTLCAAAMALSVPVAAPAIAMPMTAPAWQHLDTVEVQRSGPRRGFERRGGRGYYNNHRGYRERRPGYRQHQGWWFPPAAFIAGAIIGGAIANQPPPVRTVPRRAMSHHQAHIEWCYARYRSYRDWDNTFQPFNGPRRQCQSPYG